MTAPLKALSIMQPWAWLITCDHKDIENRDWPTKFRGPFLIHAGKKWDADAAWDLRQGINPASGKPTTFEHLPDEWDYGGIVGEAEIIDCVTASASPWFFGRYGFVIRNARPLPFRPCRGQLGFFVPDFTPHAPKPPKPIAQAKAGPLPRRLEQSGAPLKNIGDKRGFQILDRREWRLV